MCHLTYSFLAAFFGAAFLVVVVFFVFTFLVVGFLTTSAFLVVFVSVGFLAASLGTVLTVVFFKSIDCIFTAVKSCLCPFFLL
jgi:hypothetical protein